MQGFKRQKMKKKKSKKDFRVKSGVHPKNGMGAPMRGGIRL